MVSPLSKAVVLALLNHEGVAEEQIDIERWEPDGEIDGVDFLADPAADRYTVRRNPAAPSPAGPGQTGDEREVMTKKKLLAEAERRAVQEAEEDGSYAEYLHSKA